MKTDIDSSTAGPSAITLAPRSKRSLGVAHISAIARERSGLAILLVLGFVWACDWGSKITAIDSLNQAVVLTLLTTETRVYEGQTKPLEFTVRLDGAVVDPDSARITISWKSIDPTIASVDSKGVVEGVAEGQTQIVASTNGREASASVTVAPGAQLIEVLNTTALEGVAGEILEGGVGLRVKDRNDGNIGGIPVRFEVLSGGGSVESAEVITDSNGRADVQWTLGPVAGDQELNVLAQFATAAGSSAAGDAAPAGASSAPGKGVARGVKAMAKAAAPKTVTLTPESVQMLADYELEFQARVEDKFGNEVTDAELVWSTSDPSIITVSAAGMAHAVAQGSADVFSNVVGKSVSGSAHVDVVGTLGDLTISTTSLPAGTVGTPYSQTLAATGGDGTYAWALFNGTTLPAGLVLNATSGEISGTPTAQGTTNFEVAVTSGGSTDTKALSIAIASTPTNAVQVTDLAVVATTSNSVTLRFTEVDGGTGSPASYDIRYATSPMSWGGAPSVAQGTCATPVSGVAIGAPLTCLVEGLNAGSSYDFRLVSFRGTLNVNAVFGALSNVVAATTTTGPPPPPSITTNSPMPNGWVGGAYSQTLAATGGDGNYSWTMINATTLIAGLVLNAATGEISGTPTAAGTTNFEVEVTSAGQTATKALQISVDATPPPPGITTSSPMANGTVGVAYSQTLAATGGDGNYTWAMFNGTTLPGGLGLSSATGQISGTPTTAGTTNFEVEVTSAGQTATRALTLMVNTPGAGPWFEEDWTQFESGADINALQPDYTTTGSSYGLITVETALTGTPWGGDHGIRVALDVTP